MTTVDTSRLRGLPLRERIERNCIPVPECGCWIWLRKISDFGYGRLDIGGKTTSAHRASWMAFRGAIPDGMYVCHTCDVPSCVNPDHLFLGTSSENALDRERKGRGQVLKGEKNNNAKLSDHDVLDIRTSTLTRAALAEQYGVKRSTIWAIQTHRNIWPHIKAPPPAIDLLQINKRKGECHPHRKLTSEQVLTIYRSVGRPKDIARQYNITPQNVNAIRKGKTWAHLTGAA